MKIHLWHKWTQYRILYSLEHGFANWQVVQERHCEDCGKVEFDFQIIEGRYPDLAKRLNLK